MNDEDRQTTTRRIDDAVRRFRRGCRAVRLPLRERLMYWFYYLGLAHRGVQVPASDRDTVYAPGFWQRGYDKYCARLNRRLSRRGPQPATEVPAFTHGELDVAHLQRLMRANIPFVIRGGALALPMKNWSLEYLDDVAGDCAVPINAAGDRPSADVTKPTKAHHYYDFRTGTLREVTASIRAGGNMRITTAEDVMHHADGRLRRDLDLPYWERVSGWEQNRHHWLKKYLFAGKVVGAQLLLQPHSAFTLWHAEPGDNFFVLAKGVKNWTMAHPYYTAALRPRVKTTTNYHGSNIDVREPHDVQAQRGYDGYLAMPKVTVRLQPGDMLRVPNHWWHTVVTDPGEYTVAATIRSNSPPNLTGFGYGILRLFDRQYHAIARAFATEGRIHDRHIGYPRPSRSAAADATVAEPRRARP